MGRQSRERLEMLCCRLCRWREELQAKECEEHTSRGCKRKHSQ